MWVTEESSGRLDPLFLGFHSGDTGRVSCCLLFLYVSCITVVSHHYSSWQFLGKEKQISEFHFVYEEFRDLFSQIKADSGLLDNRTTASLSFYSLLPLSLIFLFPLLFHFDAVSWVLLLTQLKCLCLCLLWLGCDETDLIAPRGPRRCISLLSDMQSTPSSSSSSSRRCAFLLPS